MHEDLIRSGGDLLVLWRDDLMQWLRHSLPKLVVVVLVAVVLARLLRVLTTRLSLLGRSPLLSSHVRAQQLGALSSVVRSVGLAVIVFVSLMQVLPLFDVNMGPLLASAGVAGLAIGFGAQTLVHDVINGILILAEDQYGVGDRVKIAGVSGTVESMTLRHTVLRDSDGTVHVVPSSQITVVSNLSRDWAGLVVRVPVGDHEGSERVGAALHEAALAVRHDERFRDLVLADPEPPRIETLAGGRIEYVVLLKTRPDAQYAVGRELQGRIGASLGEAGIRLGGPIQVVGAGGKPIPLAETAPQPRSR